MEGLRSAIEYIFNLRTVVEHRVLDGLNYEVSSGGTKLLFPPTPQPVEVRTLSGFVALIKGGIEGAKEAELLTRYFVKVVDEDEVLLLPIKASEYGPRTYIARATAMLAEGFQFKSFMPPEEFIIGLASKFAESDEQKKLIALASDLTSDSSAQAVDNGVAQSIVVKDGAALKKPGKTNPRVALKPYRTFSEAEQPESDFIFRIRKVIEAQPPHCALFEADGGAWKAKAVQNIGDWFKGKTTLQIIA